MPDESLGNLPQGVPRFTLPCGFALADKGADLRLIQDHE